MCPILVAHAAEDRGYCHQQEPAHTSHGDTSNIARYAYRSPTMQPIRILVTGGTFDKEYNELTGELFFQ
ncbi:MAG: hypothetical protein NTW28_26255, partial [Candidatus Solibacter sp.]|nr:hypothetical protein [Candidatus Solibacter sp.]